MLIKFQSASSMNTRRGRANHRGVAREKEAAWVWIVFTNTEIGWLPSTNTKFNHNILCCKYHISSWSRILYPRRDEWDAGHIPFNVVRPPHIIITSLIWCVIRHSSQKTLIIPESQSISFSYHPPTTEKRMRNSISWNNRRIVTVGIFFSSSFPLEKQSQSTRFVELTDEVRKKENIRYFPIEIVNSRGQQTHFPTVRINWATAD